MTKDVSKLFESENVKNVEDKDYVIDLFKRMFEQYRQRFEELGLTDKELADKFDNNILPGFFDFALDCDYTFGSIVKPDLSNYLSIKHGCWLNTIDYMTKYPNEKYKLAMGFVVSKDDLAEIEKEIAAGFTPVFVDLIPHGFMVTPDGIFDPTLGTNELYHYFYKEVPEEVWKSFKYFYNNEKDWWVADFADWTKSQIRAAKETHKFYDMFGISDGEELTSEEDTKENTQEVQIRNDKGELVDIKPAEVVSEPSERNNQGVESEVGDNPEETSVENEKSSDSELEPDNLFSLFDSVNETLTEAVKRVEDPEGIFDDDNKLIPDDVTLESDIDKYIASDKEEVKTFSGNTSQIKTAAKAGKVDTEVQYTGDAMKKVTTGDKEFTVPKIKKDYIDDFIDGFCSKVRYAFTDAFSKEENNRNTTKTISIQGIGTFDSAAKTYYPFGQGEKSSYSKNALGLNDKVPFYVTYLYTYFDKEGNAVSKDDNPAKIVRTLTITQPKTVYQYRIQVPNASKMNRPVKITPEGEEKSMEKQGVVAVGDNRNIHTPLMVLLSKKEENDFVKQLLADNSFNFKEADIANTGVTAFTFLTVSSDDNDNRIDKVISSLKEETENKHKEDGLNDFCLFELTEKTKARFRDYINKDEGRYGSYSIIIPCLFSKEDKAAIKDKTFSSPDFRHYYIMSTNGLLESSFFEGVIFTNDDGTRDTLTLDENSAFRLSDKFVLYNVQGDRGLTSDAVGKWLYAVCEANKGSDNLCVVASEKDTYIFDIVGYFQWRDIYPSDPDEMEFLHHGVKGLKQWERIKREKDVNDSRMVYDTQTHRMRSACEEERAIDGFSATKSEIVDFNEENIQFNKDEEFINRALFSLGNELIQDSSWHEITRSNVGDALLPRLFVHYAVSLNIKLRTYLDKLIRISSAGEAVLLPSDYTGVVNQQSVEVISSSKFFELDSFVASSVAAPFNNKEETGGLEEVVKRQINLLLSERARKNAEKENVINEDIKKIAASDTNVAASVDDYGEPSVSTDQFYFVKKENDLLTFYKIMNRKIGLSQNNEGIKDPVNRTFKDITGLEWLEDDNGKYLFAVGKPIANTDITKATQTNVYEAIMALPDVVCFINEEGNADILPINEYVDKQKADLTTVRSHFDKQNKLYLDIAKVLEFGIKNKCYKNGMWEKFDSNNIAEPLSLYAFGTPNYNGMIEKLNTYFRLPRTLFPADYTLTDLRDIEQKLETAESLMKEFHDAYSDNKYHVKEKKSDNSNSDDEDSDNSEEIVLDLQNRSFYVRLFSGEEVTIKNEIETAKLADQPAKWTQLCQLINMDLYPMVLGDELDELRQLARDTKRMTVKLRMTSKMKEIASKIADVDFDFTTKMILFTALRNQTAVSNLSSDYLDILEYSKQDVEGEDFSATNLTTSDFEELGIRTSSVFENIGKNKVDLFVKQMDRIKDSPEYTFINKLLFQNMSDEEIWNLRRTFCNAFGISEKNAPELFDLRNKDTTEKAKDLFVKSVRNFVGQYLGLKYTKIATLSKRIETDTYSLVDLHNYYKTRINEVCSGLNAFVYDLSEKIKKISDPSNSSKYDNEEKFKYTVEFAYKVLNSIKQFSKQRKLRPEEFIKAMETIVSGRNLLGRDKYLWLLSTFDELSNLYEEYRKHRKEISKHIKAELGKDKPTVNEEEQEGDLVNAYNSGLDEVIEYFTRNIYETWSLNMFDSFKKDQPDVPKTEEEIKEEDLEKELPFKMTDGERNPNFVNVWRNLFGIEKSDKKFEKFLALAKKYDMIESFLEFTRAQIEDIIKKVHESSDDEFRDIFAYIDRVDMINDLAKSTHYNVSLDIVGKKKEREVDDGMNPNQQITGSVSDRTATETSSLTRKPIPFNGASLYEPEKWLPSVNEEIKQWNKKNEQYAVDELDISDETIKKVKEVLDSVRKEINASELSKKLTIQDAISLAKGSMSAQYLRQIGNVGADRGVKTSMSSRGTLRLPIKKDKA